MSGLDPFSFLRACGRYGLEALTALGYAHAFVLLPPPADDGHEQCGPFGGPGLIDLAALTDLSGAELVTWASIVVRLDPPEQRTELG